MRDRPLLIFDGDCGFCRFWVRRWMSATGDRVDYRPYQEVGDRFPQIPPSAFEVSVQLVEEDGSVHAGAAAALGALGRSPAWAWLLALYRGSALFRGCSEALYRFVAARRRSLSRLIPRSEPRRS